MTLERPRHILMSITKTPPDYSWPDSKAFATLFDDKEHAMIRGVMMFCPDRTRFGLYIALGEWITWRFEGHSQNFEQLNHFLEAMWAANVDFQYYTEGNDVWEYGSDFLWDRFVQEEKFDYTTFFVFEELGYFLDNGFGHFKSDVIPKSIVKFVYFVRHILPDPKVFSAWFEPVFKRMCEYQDLTLHEPQSTEQRALDPEDERNLRAGRPVPREAFDLEFDFDKDQTTELIHKFLQGLDHTKNPFLASPEVMLKRGFKGTPYSYTGPKD